MTQQTQGQDRSWIMESDGILTLRPDPHRLHVFFRWAALPLALLLSIRLLVLGWIGVLIVVVTVGICLAVALSVRRLRIRHAFVRLTPTAVIARPWYGRARSVLRSEISQVALVTAQLGKSAGEYDVDYMVFLDGDGRGILSASCKGISKADQQAFAAALHVDARSESLGLREMRRQYPGALSWYWNHQYLAALAIVFGIIVAVVTGLLWLAALNGAFQGPGRVGQTRSLSNVADVTVLAVDDPAKVTVSDPSIVEPGTRLVGVDIRIHNTGGKTLERPANTVRVMDSDASWDQTLGTAMSPPGVVTDVEIPPGKTVTVYVVTRVPVVARVVKVEYSYYPSRGGPETIDWIVAVPPAAAPASR